MPVKGMINQKGNDVGSGDSTQIGISSFKPQEIKSEGIFAGPQFIVRNVRQ